MGPRLFENDLVAMITDDIILVQRYFSAGGGNVTWNGITGYVAVHAFHNLSTPGDGHPEMGKLRISKTAVEDIIRRD